MRLYDYPVDGAQIAAGGVDFGTRLQQLTAVGAWITVQPPDLTLVPGEARLVTTTITIPPNARAGDYVGGVAIEDKTVQGQGTGSHVLINVHYRKVIAILDSVPGNRWASAKVLGVALNAEPTGVQAVVTLRNTGNILLKGKGTIVILGTKDTGQDYPFSIDTVLPNAVAQIPLYLPNLVLKPGTYGMSVHLNSVHHVSLASWKNYVGFMLPKNVTPGGQIKPVTLQPAQGVPSQSAAPSAVQQAAVSNSQSMPWILFGAGAILVLILGAGLGMFVSRRSARQPL